MRRETTFDPLRTLFRSGTIAGLGDAQLLERFRLGGDAAEQAFRGLIVRHGPAVLRNCRRWLAGRDDAEDAFQATFLVLARRAGAIRDGDRLDRWLYGVSRRVAARARRESARRADRERRGAAMRPERVDPRPPGGPCPELFEEVDRLPRRLREAVVLCYFEGLSNEEAARRLGCPVGTVQSRLHSARNRLRARLERRGLAPTALAIPPSPAGPVPSELLDPLVAAALRFAGGSIGPASRAASLATATLRASWASPVGGLVAAPVTAIALGLAAGWGPYQVADDPAAIRPPGAIASAGLIVPVVQPAPIAATTGLEAPVAREAPEADDDPADAGPDRTMRVRVLGPDGRPMEGVKLQRAVWTVVPVEDRNKRYVTDDRGEAEIDVPRGLRILRLWAWSEGHVPLFANWEEPENPDENAPEEFTFRLAPGTVIGGIVRNEDGEPIEGATVEVRYDRGAGSTGRIGPSTWLSESAGVPRTDAEGRWTLDNVPEGDGVEVRIKLSHPDYIDDPNWGSSQGEQFVTMAALRDRSATIVMHRGLSATGTVTDPGGNPVAGAVVIWGDDPYFSEGSQEVRTDDDGVFRLAMQPPGPLAVTVVAEGWKPAMRTIELGPELGPVDFRLEPGNLLRLRVVDGSGAPVPGVGVSIAGWRGRQSLYNHRHPNVLDTRIPVRADEQGLYEWTWAPDDAVSYRFWKEGYAGFETDLIADGTEQVVTIPAHLRISGAVSDATTGRPVERFEAMPVLEFQPNFLLVERRGVKTFTGGRYAIDRDRTDASHRVRIEAEGYRSAMSGPFRVGDPDPTFDFRLEPASPIRGRVVDPRGRPAEGARVYLASASQGIDFTELGIHEEWPYATDLVPALTDEGGAFALPSQFEPSALLVIHDDGYAEVTLQPDEQAGELSLKGWARVEGRLFQEGRPVPGAWVGLTPLRPSLQGGPRFQGRLAVKTDEQGRFAFSRVPPVKAKLQADLSVWREYPITSSRSVPLDLGPGEQAAIDLGGGGTAVSGRVVPAGEGAKDINLRYSLNTMIRPTPGIEPPEGLRSPGFANGREWDERWMSTPEGRDFLDTLHHDFVRLDPEGRFLISGVPAGEYALAIRPYEPPEGGCLVSPVGGRVVRFRVSEDASGPGLDLGEIEVEIVRGPGVGDEAPDFAIETIDGGALSLGGLRGRLVLLDFWASWCGPCVEGLPALRRLQDDFGADGRLAILGLGLDEDPAEARRFAEEHGMTWPLGLLGGDLGAEILRRYAIGSVPSYLVIDRDGTVLHRGFRVEECEEAIREALR